MGLLDDVARANPEYVESLYAQYRRDPKSVDESWALIFAGYEFARAAAGAGTAPLARLPIADLVHSYRELGHVIADLDPLGHARAPSAAQPGGVRLRRGGPRRVVTWAAVPRR